MQIGGPYASQPAIAIDSLGRVVVVWVAYADPATGLGTLFYSYRLPGASLWNGPSALSAFGADPAIATTGGTVHLTWVELSRVAHATFPTLSPFAFAQETVASTPCSQSKFRRPSITLTSPGPTCELNIHIAYLVSTGCGGVASTVGPRVMSRTTTTGWTELYSNIIGILGSATAATPVSLSLSGDRATGALFLAWSDKLGGAARTMLAKRSGTTWTAAPQSTTARHVHVRAASSTKLRLGWTAAGVPSDPYFGASTFVDTATWTGATPSWTGTLPVSVIGAGRPQAVFWKRCVSGLLTEVRGYFEATDSISSGRRLAITFDASVGCPPSIGSGTACKTMSALAASVSLPGQVTPGTLIDLDEVGVITRLSTSAATVTTSSGSEVTVAWRSGDVVASSDTTLTLTAPRADVTVTSSAAAISVVELGQLTEYDAPRVP